jgi:DNA-binding beta-propeller fold protein YncE
MRGKAGGEYPVDVLWTSVDHGYVLSLRDREIISLGLGADKIKVDARLALPGQPARMILDKARGRIYVAVDTADQIVAIDLKSFKQIASLPIRLPNMPKEIEGKLGTGLNSLSLSPDGNHLWATLGALNAVASIKLGDDDGDDDEIGMIEGLVPTGWYPTASLVTKSGHLLVTHGKSLPGPNPGACRTTLSIAPEEAAQCNKSHQYVLQLEHGGIVSMPVPKPADLKRTSLKVAANNNLLPPKDHAANAALMKALSSRIKHVIYIVKENRTYDQILGDLPGADGDPKLALLAPFSPNHKAIARNFVTLDRAYASGEVSNTGWMWSTAGRATDALERTSPVNYAGRGLDYGSEGMNRNINVGLADPAERRKTNPNHPDDPNMLPGTADTSAPDAKIGEAGTSFLWSSVARAGLSVRNYGFFVDDQIYKRDRPGFQPTSRHPFAEKMIQAIPTHPDLMDVTDPYFRSFDMSTPDYWRYLEWQREFDLYEQKGELPNLTLLRLSHDHFGDFKIAEDGVNTIETQMADNDYAVGLVVERVAKSKFANSTLIVTIEDDAQNGADHVDARRTVVLVAGAYVRQGAVISDHYTTVSLLRTITDILGAEPVGLQAALAEPMAKVFDLKQKSWTYQAIVPEVLRQTDLPVPGGKAARAWTCPVRDANYWAEAMKGQDFSSEDRLDSAAFNRALEQGLAPVRLNPACAGLATR